MEVLVSLDKENNLIQCDKCGHTSRRSSIDRGIDVETGIVVIIEQWRCECPRMYIRMSDCDKNGTLIDV